MYVFSVGSAFTEALTGFESYVFSEKHPGVVRVVNNVLNNAGIYIAAWIAQADATR